jgi:serine/threonine protein kinase
MTINEASTKRFPSGIPKDIALDWMIQMAEAIHYLHTEKGVCHRDLHGGNWMVTDDNKSVTLIDFGTSLIVGKGLMVPKTFAFHAFQSPQIIAGLPGSFDGDIWYLGMIFFSFVNKGCLPWNGYNMG